MFEQAMRQKPAIVLGLATGSTPILLYKELIRRKQAGVVDFSKVTTFNLDEYVGLEPRDPNSYRFFMNNQLFEQVNVSISSTHVPSGVAEDLEKECDEYEKKISGAGGIDLQLLGVGRNGHIGFNEPGTSLASRTHVQILASQTVADNARFFGGIANVPRRAVTMGVGTILDARRIVLLAVGSNKADIVRDFIEGPVTSMVTASALQLHRDVTVVVDEAAAGKLCNRQYYDECEQVRNSLAKQD
jgi:glucosamine-6-phosphate deaminase